MVSLLLEVTTSIAGVLMSLAHVPQAYKIWRRKSAKDVSITMYTLFFLGTIIWLIYGIAIGSTPLIVSYLVGVISTSITYGLVLYYR